MRGGQNKRSTSEKLLRGTYREDRDRPGPAVKAAAVGPPPRKPTAREKAIWRALAPQVERVFSESDRTAFELLVKLRAKLEDTRLPAHAFSSLAKTVVGLLERFGCVPSARSRVEPVKREGEPDEAERFLFGPALAMYRVRPQPRPADPLDDSAAPSKH